MIAEYRLPQHVHNQLFVEVVPVEKTDQGEPLYLEVHVDAWLTARYAVAPWRSGCGFATTVSHIKTAGEENAFVTVAEAQHRFLSGERSIRWWYRMAKIGKIVHHRVGESIRIAAWRKAVKAADKDAPASKSTWHRYLKQMGDLARGSMRPARIILTRTAPPAEYRPSDGSTGRKPKDENE